MGVLNVTPDSFSDGGRFFEPDAALARGRSLLDEGADLIDVGGESTRPSALPVPAEEQWRRIGPVVAALAAAGACVSVDTASAVVARQALDAGASVVNDVTALGDPAMAEVVREAGAGLVLMHMRGVPATMQQDPRYDDVVREVRDHLAGRMAAARSAGVGAEAIVVDPGLGFGKTADHNLTLLAGLGELCALGRPVMIGASRKRFLGGAAGAGVEARLEAGLAVAALAVDQGAAIVRTHDVAATRRAVEMAAAVRAARRTRERTRTGQ